MRSIKGLVSELGEEGYTIMDPFFPSKVVAACEHKFPYIGYLTGFDVAFAGIHFR